MLKHGTCMKTKNKSTFKYQQIKNMIAAKIQIGAYPDNLLPSEQELSLKYKAGRNIIRLALAHLEKENLIIKTRGRRAKIISSSKENSIAGKNLILLQTSDCTQSTSPVYYAIISTLLNELASKGASVENIYIPDNCTDNYLLQIKNKIREADGIIFTSLQEQNLPQKLISLLKEHPAIIGFDYVCSTFSHWVVGTNNYEGGRMAANVFNNSGRKNPLVFCCAPSFLRYSPFMERIYGFQAECNLLGITLKREQVVFNNKHFNPFYIHKLLEHVIKHMPKTDFIFCITDQLAHHVCSALAILGKHVPEDIAVLGFDGIDLPNENIKLSSIRQPVEAIARKGIELMIDVINKKVIDPCIYPISPTIKQGETL